MKTQFRCNFSGVALPLVLICSTPAGAADFSSKNLDMTIQSDYVTRSEYSGPLASAFGFQCRSSSLPKGADLFNGSVSGFRVGLSTENQNPIRFEVDPAGAITSFAIIFSDNQPSLVDAIRAHSLKMQKRPMFKYLVDRGMAEAPVAVIDIVNRIAYGVDVNTKVLYSYKSDDVPLTSPSTKVTSIIYCVPDLTVNLFSQYISKPLLANLKSTVLSN